MILASFSDAILQMPSMLVNMKPSINSAIVGLLRVLNELEGMGSIFKDGGGKPHEINPATETRTVPQ